MFEDVAAKAGVLDHGAGMSAAFLDFDNDGRLDIYTGNMWSDNGLRATALPAFMKDASDEVRALYRRHARGNSLFRNTGDGRFEDVTLPARAAFGRWAWSSDALDFDGDGFEDLYIVNGMLTRASGDEDLDGFFWRQVVARSPQTRVTGTPYDDAWRAMNQRLTTSSIASHQRNVLLRNDGHGGFDEVSGTAGLDLDQDGRSFGVLDLDGDLDPDLVLMAARQAPQLRVFRNDYAGRHAALALRLRGTASNRDAVGARVSVETERMRRTKQVQAGSGFLSQHSKELLFGLGQSRKILKLDRRLAERPRRRSSATCRSTAGSGWRKAASSASSRCACRPRSPWTPCRRSARRRRATAGFTSRSRRPHSRCRTSTAKRARSTRSRAARPCCWPGRPELQARRSALQALAAGSRSLAAAGVGTLALAIDAPAELPRVRAAASGAGSLPVVLASQEVATSYAILNRHLFMNRQDLRLPTAFLLDAEGRVVKVYRDRLDASAIARDASRIEAGPAERLARAVPFAGTLYSPPGRRNYLPYGHELLDQGLDASALGAFERAVQANPDSSTLYRLGTLLMRNGQTDKARAVLEQALAKQPDLAEASNDLGTLLAQGGDLPAAIERFRAALRAAPDYPDALNNLGYALLLSGRESEARELYEKALALQADFPEALNNLGLILGRRGELPAAEARFRQALERRPDYGEAANNLALVLVARGDPEAAVRLLEDLLARDPGFENAYITLAKIHLVAQRRNEAQAVLQRLLQRNPSNPLAREILDSIR